MSNTIMERIRGLAHLAKIRLCPPAAPPETPCEEREMMMVAGSSNGEKGGDEMDGAGGGGKIMLKVLDGYMEKRKWLLGYLKLLEPVADLNAVVHVLALLLTVWIMTAALTKLHALTIFSFHVIFMSIGCVLIMTEGLVAYRNRSCFNCFSPIMRNNARVKLQNIHRTLQIMALTFQLLGLAFILSNKLKRHSTVVPISIHSFLGTIVCVAMVAQISFGVEKLDALRASRVERTGAAAGGIHRWHGKAGLALYDIVVLTVLTGCFRFLTLTVMNGVLALHILILWALVSLQMQSKARLEDFETMVRSGVKDSMSSSSSSSRQERNGGSTGGGTNAMRFAVEDP